MGKFDNVLILSDFDGTFAGKGSRLIERNLGAIEYFKREGGFFTLSTGRLLYLLSTVCPSFREIVNYPLILSNGAILYDPRTDTVLFEHFFDGARARDDMKDIMSKFDVVKFGCYADDGKLQAGISPDDAVGDKWIKANINYSSDDEARRAAEYIKKTYPDRYNCFRSSYSFTGICGIKAGKGKRIAELRSLSDKPLKVFCIGDFQNDIEMLEAADVSFCPQNALDEVKSVCDHVVCHHDEGAIADMIKIIEEKYI